MGFLIEKAVVDPLGMFVANNKQNVCFGAGSRNIG